MNDEGSKDAYHLLDHSLWSSKLPLEETGLTVHREVPELGFTVQEAACKSHYTQYSLG